MEPITLLLVIFGGMAVYHVVKEDNRKHQQSGKSTRTNPNGSEDKHQRYQVNQYGEIKKL